MALLEPLEVKLAPLQSEFTSFESCFNRRDSGNIDGVLRIPSCETRDETCASASTRNCLAFSCLVVPGSARG